MGPSLFFPWLSVNENTRRTIAQKIRAMFVGGVEGAWYDPSDLSTMFQDSAGTIPVTATGDPVGRINDKSGNGNHAVQATSGKRPIFRDVGGYRYLEFDGVDDYLRATFTIAQPIDRISGLQQVTWSLNDRAYSGATADSCRILQSVATPTLALNSGSSVVMVPDLALLTNGVITERHNGASSRIALNAGAYQTGSAGATEPGGLTIAASSTPSNYANFNLYQLIMRGSTTAFTDAQVSACRALCAVKSGVTL